MTDRGLLHAGEHVTYTAHPDWGTGTIQWTVPPDRLQVRFNQALPPYEGEFHALELRHVTRPKPRT